MGTLGSLLRNALLASSLWVVSGCVDPTPQDKLEWALNNGSLEETKAALDAGARVDVPLPSYQKEKQYPLHGAASLPGDKALPICKLLLEKGAKVDTTDAQGRTVMFSAAAPEVIALLAAKGAKVDATIEGGWTPLMTAASLLMPATVKGLLAAGADRNKRNGFGRTAADEAMLALRTKENSAGPAIVAERSYAQEILTALAGK